MSDGKLKSAYELAMERLSSKDPDLKEASLSTETKQKIAAIRAEYEAKIAEREIMFKSKSGELHREFSGPELMVRRNELEITHRTAIEVLKKTQEDKIRAIRGSH